jgi:hypothetical protein
VDGGEEAADEGDESEGEWVDETEEEAEGDPLTEQGQELLHHDLLSLRNHQRNEALSFLAAMEELGWMRQGKETPDDFVFGGK